MLIIPSINAQSFEEAESKLRRVESFLPRDGWVQIDVADGLFTDFKNWGTPQELAQLRTYLNIELHLMIVDVESALRSYVDTLRLITSARSRIIVHVETVRDMSYILGICGEAGVEVGVAVNPRTPVESALIYLRAIPFIQFLGVEPGPSGQVFIPSTFAKIRVVKTEYPNVIIEIDGGITPEVTRQVKEAGANAIVSGSYIFNHPVPKVAYEELAQI